MRRITAILAVALLGLFIISEGSTKALDRGFAERFITNGQTDKKGETGPYNFDKNHTFIGFKVKHMGLIEVPGFFRDFTGTVNYDAADVTKSTVEFIAKVTSIDTGVAGRDTHLRSDDFFDVEKFPEMTFKSTSVAKKGKKLTVSGDLTMKGVTKPVSIPFELTGFIPGERGTRMGITGETTINRRDFGVNYGNNLPGTNIPQVADNIKVVLQIEAVKPKAAAGAPSAAAPKP
jgi:polyisoprenoid-binding protein YceI